MTCECCKKKVMEKIHALSCTGCQRTWFREMQENKASLPANTIIEPMPQSANKEAGNFAVDLKALLRSEFKELMGKSGDSPLNFSDAMFDYFGNQTDLNTLTLNKGLGSLIVGHRAILLLMRV